MRLELLFIGKKERRLLFLFLLLFLLPINRKKGKRKKMKGSRNYIKLEEVAYFN